MIIVAYFELWISSKRVEKLAKIAKKSKLEFMHFVVGDLPCTKKQNRTDERGWHGFTNSKCYNLNFFDACKAVLSVVRFGDF
jgi:hypothetical protein